MSKTKKIKIPHEKLKNYFEQYDRIDNVRWAAIERLERKMQKEFKEPLLGFHVSEYGIGIGTPDKPDRMDLVQPKVEIE